MKQSNWLLVAIIILIIVLALVAFIFGQWKGRIDQCQKLDMVVFEDDNFWGFKCISKEEFIGGLKPLVNYFNIPLNLT